MDTEPPPRSEPLPFTDEEYAARLAAVRRNMEAAGGEVMRTTVPENIVYLTGYHSLGYFTFRVHHRGVIDDRDIDNIVGGTARRLFDGQG